MEEIDEINNRAAAIKQRYATLNDTLQKQMKQTNLRITSMFWTIFD